jgi:hypothetical protein
MGVTARSGDCCSKGSRAGLLLVDARFVVDELVRLISARVADWRT